jgi:hypothetical protein
MIREKNTINRHFSAALPNWISLELLPSERMLLDNKSLRRFKTLKYLCDMPGKGTSLREDFAAEVALVLPAVKVSKPCPLRKWGSGKVS